MLTRTRFITCVALLAGALIVIGQARAQLPMAQPALTLDAAGGAEVLVRQSDGMVVAGGWFTKVNGVARANLARFNADGTLDAAFDPMVDGPVTAIVVANSAIYVAGQFTRIDGVARSGLAKLSLVDGSVDLDFDPAPDAVITALAADVDGNIYAGGTFTSIGGVAGRNLAKLNGATGAADNAWNPVFPEPLAAIGAVGANGAFLYVVGAVASDPNGLIGRAHRVVRATGDNDATWSPPLAHVNNEAYAVTIAFDAFGNAFLAGPGYSQTGATSEAIITVEKLLATTGAPDPGWVVPAHGTRFVVVDGASVYTQVSGTSFSSFLSSITKRSGSSGAVDTAWSTPEVGTLREVNAAIATPEGIWVAGSFSYINGNLAPGIARLDAGTGAVQPAFAARATTQGSALTIAALPNGTFLVGGSFDYVNGLQRSNLARLHSDGSLDPTWTTQSDGVVIRLAVHGGHVYAGGSFNAAGGLARRGVARIDVESGIVDVGWNPNTDGNVRHFAFDGTDVYLGGSFFTVGGTPRPVLAKVSGIDGALIEAFAPPYTKNKCAGVSRGLAYANGYVYAGLPGRDCLPVIGAIRHLNRFSATTGAHDPSWNPAPDATVLEILISGTDAYLAGGFATVGGVAKPGLAKIDLTTGALDAAWGDVSLPDHIFVYTAALVGPHVYVGGNTYDPISFVYSGFLGRHALATGLRDTGWNPLTDSFPYGLAGSLTGDRVFVAGFFSAVSGQPREGIAAFQLIEPPALASAVSRRVHGAAGTFNLPLSLVTTTPTTEPRQGPAQTVVFTFDKPVIGGTAQVTAGTAVAGPPTFSGSEMIVPLTGVTNQQYVTVAVNDVAAADGGTGGDVSVRVGFLLGDVNQNRAVSLSDLGQVNAQIAQPVTAANFLKDVNVSGTLSLADKGITNTQVTKALPAP